VVYTVVEVLAVVLLLLNLAVKVQPALCVLFGDRTESSQPLMLDPVKAQAVNFRGKFYDK
jgi:hydroxyethylthiazole kinase-like sugar kinase family protein